MKIGVFGAGAIGKAIASFIYSYNKDIIYLVALDKYYKRLENGINVNNIHYDVAVSSDIKPDYLFVCVKNYDLEKSLDDIIHFVDKNTVIIPLLNGICAHDVLQKRFPLNKVCYSMIKIEANQNDNGDVITSKVILLGLGDRYNVGEPDYLKPLCEVLKKSDINYKVFDDMLREVWRKWMLNIGINQVSALTNSNYTELKHPYIKEIMLNLFKEIVSLALVCGVDLHLSDAEKLIADLDTRSSDRYTSMAMDFKNKRRNELEYFSGYALKLAKEHQLNLPYNEMIYKLLKAISDNYMMKVE